MGGAAGARHLVSDGDAHILPVRYCGRDFSAAEVDTLRALAQTLPTRSAIAEALCKALGWARPDGRTKAMSARVALVRMHADGLIELPLARNTNGNGRLVRHLPPDHQSSLPVVTTLAGLGPLRLELVKNRAASRRWNELIARHHYLGYIPLAGAQLRYLVESDAGTLGALGFGASAWKCAPRDTFIGWDPPTRERRLALVVGNARFLILPHVRVPHLASAILGRTARRLAGDWEVAYGYRPVLLETFVETPRFAGTSYRAANWIHVGHTAGRGKRDRHHAHAVPVKDVYLYPLASHFRRTLTSPV